ncbi:MAG: sulfotransferase domain-containing protein [Chthoniobacterales bacterium]|nr:sulfotransferase domain-containing protein [Chthoniobacterales bacterium]
MRQGTTTSAARLPDFLLIGATKAGTSSLDFYLSLHPEIHMARPKEPRYFVDDAEPFGRWSRGEAWYRSLFASPKRLAGETSPYYTDTPAEMNVARRAAHLLPGAKIIYVVREPMARLRSHFLMLHRNGREHESLPACLARQPEPRLLLASLYATQLAEWRRFYPPERILVLDCHDLETWRRETMRRVFEFLGVNPDFRSVLFAHRRNVTKQQIIPTTSGRRILQSRPMRYAERTLPDPVFYHLKNIVLRPFAGNLPETSLPPGVEETLRKRLRDEVVRLREMSGETLRSLG